MIFIIIILSFYILLLSFIKLYKSSFPEYYDGKAVEKYFVRIKIEKDDFSTIYCMSKKSCPIFVLYTQYKIEQDFMDTQDIAIIAGILYDQEVLSHFR